MVRKIAFLLAFMLLLTGCVTSEPTTVATEATTTHSEIITNTLPPLVQINGILYQEISMLDPDTQVDEDLIVGYTTAPISITMCPERDGESNFAPEGSPYAKWSTEEYPDAYVIYYTWRLVSGWYLLIPVDEVS